MTFKLKRLLWLWAGALAIALLVIIALSVWTRTLAILAVIVGVLLICRRIGEHAARQCDTLVFADNQSLPKASYRQPVVLVCGDGLVGLFGAVPIEQLALRTTGKGCYIRVPDLELFAQVVDSLMASRPDWGRQLSVMFIINPQAHTDREVLAGRLRALRHQLQRVRKQGIALPLMLIGYLQVARGEGPWFSWEQGRTCPRVRQDGACDELDDWQTQAADSTTRAARVQACVRLSSAATWLSEVVLPHLAARDAHNSNAPVASAFTLVTSLPHEMPGNLWEQWLREKTALVGGALSDEARALPFPDPLLALLVNDTRYAPSRRAGLIALWLLAAAGLVALVSSAWQNTLLARQVSDDLRRYTAIPHNEFARREEAMSELRQVSSRLDGYYRHGEPLSLGFGLYRGNILREQLLTVIGAHRQPIKAVASTVRLDSLSLFNSGSAQLKPDSTKVLINALASIKAQPGWLIVIAGHTDASGSAEHNLQLSRARAAAVHSWMRQMGDIPDSCFAVQGFGASQPIASNDTEAGRQANRRVDIRLIPEAGACVLPVVGSGMQPEPHTAAFTY
ncbi:OmpA family protein [Pseudomonas putida]|uniref:OmpA family protein n=1 Tax=Pseudomonas putida TaxID=303 RepID=A0A2Z4RE07_PSEPU|nr:OmpA family protein [Pseudomonas putida]AWY38568.1 OmpA family protein [Pseudomonas putida]